MRRIRTRTRTRTRRSVLAVLPALVGAGCLGNGDDGSTAETTTDAPVEMEDPAWRGTELTDVGSAVTNPPNSPVIRAVRTARPCSRPG